MDQVSALCTSQPLRKERWIFFYIWKLERKKNEEIKGRISRRNLVLFHIKQQMIHNTCTKLQNPTCSSSWEIFVTNFPKYYIGVRDRKKEKEGKINISFFAVPQYTWPLPMCIQNWKTLALIEAKKFVAENLLGEKEKWTNKAMIISSRLILFYTFNDTTNHTQHLYQISKS